MILPGKKHIRLHEEAAERAVARHQAEIVPDVVPGFIAAFVVLIVGLACSIKAFEATNPRLSYPAQPLALEADSDDAGRGIWFSLSAPAKNIVVTTDDQKIFEWPLDPLKAIQSKSYLEFSDYLRNRRKQVVEDLVLSMNRDGIESKSRAVIAVDEHLTYAHFKPIMLALSSAGIRSYGFETRSDGD